MSIVTKGYGNQNSLIATRGYGIQITTAEEIVEHAYTQSLEIGTILERLYNDRQATRIGKTNPLRVDFSI